MKRLYLVRHGQTEFNTKRIVQGRCDSPLTELGREQALAAGRWLADHEVHPQAVGTSPMGRAVTTMGLVLGVLSERELLDLDTYPQVVAGLAERAYGCYERGPMDDVCAPCWDPGEALVPHGGEGNSELRPRVLAALRELLAPEDVDCAIAVSHGSATLQFLKATLPADEVPEKLPNCCVVVCDHDVESGAFLVRELADPLAS